MNASRPEANTDPVRDLLAELAARDIRLWAENGALRYDAPAAAFGDELKARVRQHKAELLDSLTRRGGDAGEGPAPLSCQQERMWFLNRLEGSRGLYVESLVHELKGDLDEGALVKSLDWLVARHPALRSVFREGPQGPEQVALPAGPADLARVDLSAGEATQQPEALRKVLTDFANPGLDLAHGPVIRFALIRLEARRHVLVLAAHHAAVDGWSGGIMLDDLVLAYNAYLRGDDPQAPTPATTYAAYAAEQRRQVEDGSLDRLAVAWALELDGFPLTPGLPLDHPRPLAQAGHGAELPLNLPPSEVAALTEAAHHHGATFFAVLLAAYGVMQARASGRRRLLVGVPTAGRPLPELETVVGYFSNTVPVSLDLTGAESWGEAVARARDAVLAALARQDIPLERLIHAVAPPRSPAYSPLFQILFSLQPRPAKPPALTGLTVTRLPGPPQPARYDLTLLLGHNAEGGVEGLLVYDADLFTPARAEGWRRDFLDLLAAAAAGANPSLDLPADPGSSPSPHLATTRAPGVVEPPATPTEKRLAELWDEFLDAPAIGRQDDFFLLGGHSLLLMRLVNRVAAAGLGQLELSEVMGATSLAAMAALLDGTAPTAIQASGDEPCAPAQVIEYPASPGQEGMWLERRDRPDSVAYSVPFKLKLPAAQASPELVGAALEFLAARQAIMRTVLVERDGVLLQRLLPEARPDLTVHDLRGATDPQSAQAALTALVQAEYSRPFDLARGPLFRFHLCLRADGGADLVGNADHAVFDGWSLDILRRELTDILSALTQSRRPELQPLPQGYGEIVRAWRENLAGVRGADLRAFWRERLTGLDLGGLPQDGQPQPVGLAGRRHFVSLSPEASVSFDRLAADHRVTPAVVWTAAVAALLSRYKDGQTGLAVGVPFAGRREAHDLDLIGYFVNLLPVRPLVECSQSMASLLAATRAELVAVIQHQDTPLSWLAAEAVRMGLPPGAPLFDAVAALAEEESLEPELADIQTGAGKFPLMLTLARRPVGYALAVEYDPGLFAPRRIERMAEHLQRLLVAAAAEPRKPVGELDILPPAERELLLAEFNQTIRDYPRDASLAALFRAAAARHAQFPALVWSQGALTYAELDRQSDRLAAGLAAAGARPGEVVALALERGPWAVAAILGVAKAGCAYLPLDPGFPATLVRRLLGDTGARLVMADAPGRERLSGAGLGDGLLALEMLAQGDPTLEAPALPDPPGGLAPAYVMFTSGTTGEPKGVVVPQRAVARLALDTNFLALTPEDGVAQAAPLGFDAATLEIWPPLLNGARVCLVEDEALTDPAALRARLTTLGVSVMWLTASLMNRLAEEDPTCFCSLRVLLSGGEALSALHARRVLEACPGLSLLNGYGPTENTTFTTTHAVTQAEARGAEIPIGRPIAGTTAYVLDRLGNLAPLGVWGELHAGGDGLALGYAGRPDLSATAFITPAWLPGQRLYRTGDLARWREDGVLLFGGRRDGQVKVRGHRVETAAVEAALRDLPGVSDAVVLALGQGAERTLAAAVTATEAVPDDPQTAWRERLGQSLPSFMVPERFLVLPRLPITANGKADRRALAEMLAHGPASPAVDGGRPSSVQERLLAELWGELFPGVDLQPASDFFILGGHSLMAMRLAGLIEKRAGWRPAVRDLMIARTLGAMAKLLEAGPAPGQSDVIPKAPGPDYPLSSGQARLWMLARLYPESAAYNVPLYLHLDGELDVEALQRALTALEKRQHALRLRLTPASEGSSGRRQRLVPPGRLALRRTDCAEADDPAAEAAMLVEAEVLRPFRLEHEPLVRALLLRLGENRWRLLLVLHHAVCDAWSLPVLWRDLGALYARQVGRPGQALPELTRGYEDFAAWQQNHLSSPAGRELLARWRERLTPLPEPLALPLDRPRPPVRRFRGGFVEMALSPAASQALEDLAAANGATPFAALLGLLQVLLWRHTGQIDLALGTLVAGRERAVLADLAGFFVNTLVLRQRIDPEATLTQHLNAARESLLTAMADQDCPFEALVEAAGAPRDTSRNPIFDVLAVWQDEPPALPELPGLAVAQADAPFPFAKFDLGFHFYRAGGAIRAQVEYDADIFDRSNVDALISRLRHLVDQALQAPGIALADLEIMDAGERTLVVEGFNATARPLDYQSVIPAPFLAQAAATPESPAVLWDGGSFSYAQFAVRAAGVAARLTEAGAGPGQVVALCARRSPEMLLGIHGILLAGAAYAPLDPDHPEARRADMLEDLGDPLILAPPALADLFPGRRVLILDGDQTARPALPPIRPEDLAYVIFTSGSTGRPKGAMIEHQSALNRILWMQEVFPLGPGDVILQKTPVTFDVSVWELFWWSWVGASVALAPQGAERDPKALVEAVAKHGVTVMHFVPSMLAEFLAYLESGRAAVERLAGLRYVFASGEALDAGLVERFNRLLYAPYGVELHNLYGPTEAAVDVSWQPCSPWSGGVVVPIGRPIANTRLYVLDKDLKPLPVGVAGEVCIGGVQVGRGYIKRPELTAERFVADPFVPGGRIYRTGDLGRWRSDGSIEYLGRSDHQVKVRGHRIELAEIEHALETHPGVTRAAVMPVKAAGLVELHAYILGDEGLDSAGLRGHLRQTLPEYMLPARFLRLVELPLTTSGKVDRKALSGHPLDHRQKSEGLAPFEADMLAIWRELLPGADLGVRDSFFDAGGNSLLLIRLHEHLDARWPGVFSVAELFGRPTVADQAALLAGALPAPRTEVACRAQAGPVAIVGLAVRLAGAEGLDDLWRNLAGGLDLVRPLPAQREAEARALLAALDRPGPAAFREAAYLDDVYGFDPRRLRLSPMDATLLDPEQRLFLETAVAALEDAGYGGDALDRAKVGVFAGVSPLPYYREAMGRLHPERAEQVFALNVPSNLATRLSFLHDWRGPAALVDTACSSGLAAVHLACQALARGECQAALVGSAKALLLPPDQDGRLTIDSSTARTRAFAVEADGTGMGEGAVAMLLRPLEAALADGDAIHAVILGSAMNQDGASSGMAAPNPEAQAEVIAAAAQTAGVSLGSLSYLEAHGTGTALGDPIEIAGLTRAFAAQTNETGFAAIGAVKGNYGHLDAAAGALGLAKAVLCLKRDAAPPQPFFTAPNPRIDFAHAPVRVTTALEPLADRGTPRRAGVSSFGLSGINVHLILEAAPAPSVEPAMDRAWHVVGLSTASPEALRSYAASLAAALRATPIWSLASVAFTLALGREPLAWRAALPVSEAAALLAWLDDLAAGKTVASQCSRPEPIGRATSVPARAGDRQEAEATARIFLAGGGLTWPSGPRPLRMHLPPTPFVRQDCRPEFISLAPAKPLLGEPVTTAQGQAWRVPLEQPDFWPMAEHRLDGRPTLVGMALPGLLAEAARAAGLGSTLRIDNLTWVRPLRLEAIPPGSASLLLATASSDARFEASLGAQGSDGQWVVFAQAKLSADSAPAPSADLAGLRARCSQEVTMPPFVPVSGPVEVSRRWDCRARVWRSGDGQEGLALLRLPQEFAADCQRFPLHPALLDVAASLSLDRSGRLPAGCASMRVFAHLPTEVLAHIIRRQANDHELLADVNLYDPDGALVLAMTGLRFISLGLGQSVPTPAMSLPGWRPAPLPADAACPGPLALIGEGDLSRRLAEGLAQAGLLAGQCGSAHPDPALLQALLDGRCAGLLLAPAGGDDLAWRAASVLRSLLSGLRHPLKVLLVGHGAYALNDADPSSGPEAGLLAGLSLAAGQEEPLLAVRYLDLDPTTPAAAAAAEFAAFTEALGVSSPVALLRGGRRYAQTLLPLPEGTVPLAWPKNGCCLVTGGLGGFALTLAQEMAGEGELALALISRRGSPDGEGPEATLQLKLLAELARNGVRYQTYACDVTDRAALAATLDRVRAELGPITAVAHAAGRADGAFLLRRERAEFEAVLAAKVQGARHLDELTRQDPLQAFVLFGSLTGLTGAPGQTAYAAANAYLAALASWRRRQDLPALCIDWCALEDVGMAARSERGRGYGPSINAVGARAAWRAALSCGQERVTLLPPLPVEADALLAPATSAIADAPPVAAPRSAQEGDLAQALAAMWAQVLGYGRVGLEDNFFSLGGDSITAMQIVNRLTAEHGLPVSLAMVFEHPTPAGLALALREAPASGPATLVAPAPPAPDYPLAWEQLAVIQAEAAGDMGTAFNLPCLVELPVDVDLARLREALDRLVARREILRTRFLRAGDYFRMQVIPASPLNLPVLDLSPGQDIREIGRSRVRPFDLFSAPPVRAELLRPAQGPCLLFLDLHHALADGLSQEVLVAELAALYAGEEPPAPARQFKDYAWWSREGAGAARMEKDRTWWRERFAGPLPLIDLPADHPRPARHTWRGDTVSFALEPDLLRDLRAYAAASQATVFAVVLAAWAALIHRLARSEDVVIAVPADSRDLAGLADLPGMLVSLLPLRLAVKGDTPASELVRRAQTVHAEALGHRACNLGLLLADLAPPASPERTLLSEVTLSYMNFAEAAPATGQPGGFKLLGLTRDSCKNDLGIFVRDLPGQMVVSLEYYADLFARPRMEDLGHQFQTLLAGLVHAPSELTVVGLPLLTPDDQARLLTWGQGAEPDLPLGAGIFSLFAAQVARRGEAVAVEETGRRTTYAELHAQALTLAAGLTRAGVGPGDRVALHMQRGCPVVAALLGILAAGAAYVPLDPSYPAERNRFILADARCRVVLADPAGREALGPDAPCLVLSAEDLLRDTETSAAIAELPRVDGLCPAYVMYTSGSTGQPKGVLIPQRAVVRLALGADYAGLGPQDRLMQTGPLAFDASTFEIWSALLNGGRICMADWEDLLDPAKLAALIARFKVTILWLTTGLFNRQVEHDPASFRGARVVITGGEALSATHAQRALAACPEVTFLNGYGPTENTTFSLVHKLTQAGLDSCPAAIGRPIPHSSALVLDPAGGLVPPGAWGEICVGGPGLADGYWDKPELSAERFVSHPWRAGERLYRTGDLGRWRSDGTLEFGGRQDNQVKLRGLRIELEEIERALAEHPAIARAVALMHQPSTGDAAIVAALLPAAEGVSFDLTAMHHWLGRKLPAYMVPARFLVVSDIPLTANGKVDRQALLSRMAQDAGDADGGEHAPRGPFEEMVAEVFSDVFGRPVRDRRHGFLDLGGHSLLAIKMVNRLAERTGVRLGMRDFYAAASITELASLYDLSGPAAAGGIPPAPKADFYPASHSQQRLYLLHQLEGGSAAYNMCFAFRCSGELDAEALTKALGWLCERHEPLRTGFEERDGQIVQRIAPGASPAVAVDDLRGDADPWEHALRLARQETSLPFDLARPPMVRARIMRVAADENLCLLLLHHILGDGWSSRILVSELEALYAEAATGKPARLQPLPLTYKDFAVWQRAQRFEGASEFWRNRLAGAPPRVALPTTRPLPENQSYRGATCHRGLDPWVLAGLRSLARVHATTLGPLGLALFAALLYRLTRQRDMVLGMGVAGRERTGLEGLIGFFVNVLPIRLSLNDDTELGSLIAQTREAVLEALDRRDYPFDLLVRDLAPPRQGNRQPLINVVFEYQNFGDFSPSGTGLPIKTNGEDEVARRLEELVDSPTAKHDLLVFLVEEAGGARLQMEYDTDIVDSATAERWLSYLAQFMVKAAEGASDQTQAQSHKEPRA